MYKHILAAIDLDEDHELIVEKAAEMARIHDAKLGLIHVVRHEFTGTAWTPSVGGYGLPGLPTAADIKKKADAARAVLDDLAKRHQPPAASNHVWIASSVRSAVREVALKEKADLIVIGSHMRSRLERLLYNSAGYQIVRESPCDVLVVDQPDGA